VRQYALEGPLESLTSTDVAQPALFSLSLAVAEAARDAGLRPDFVAGHSLGEYTAAVAAGALSLEDGIRLVCLRGRLILQGRTPMTTRRRGDIVRAGVGAGFWPVDGNSATIPYKPACSCFS
jgi:acyl transferase domain-containing protein